MNVKRTLDYVTVAKLNKRVHDQHEQMHPYIFKPYNYDEVKSTFKQLMQNENFLFLLIENEQESIGYAWIEFKYYPENTFMKGYRAVQVHQISISEEEKGKGYGSKLMKEIEQLAQKRNVDVIELDYWYGNDDASKFYEKHGFRNCRDFMMKDLKADVD
ncbi:GNAT family N-acetyltransferase [Texcoconibacillus texcoconensis]|uniref:Ribosomal protein S18 acetylase RimI-like enzyme n=1 Tax=Texcoconibacillus texcoconensis TaxID=1095777 RepID=A0A840QLQ0_9BACI|nr:GNAT family N-acetyltransferase [Texcoconibacillus texcoconensis]MBB5172270.1 ribosomal protein S18 acetylase RimI-like enzyme [Texcoconibacillus texcoconensis]